MEPARTTSNCFERHPRLTLVAITAVLVLAVDLALARLIGPDASPADVETSYRVASPIYHHDLKAKASVDEARWGQIGAVTGALADPGRCHPFRDSLNTRG